MTTVAVIPARYSSTRFPGKALAKDTGKYLVQHVYERVEACAKIDRVIVATDDERIVQAVKSFGGEARLTRADHTSGTDRTGEAVSFLGLAEDDLVLNVQGDEPDIDPDDLAHLVDRMTALGRDYEIGTLAARFDDAGPKEGPGSPLDPNCVKVVADRAGRAMYFSRSPIPYLQDRAGAVDVPSRWLLHLGVYAFRLATLRAITSDGGLKRGVLEEAESLEQLRWLEHGIPVLVLVVDRAYVGIDTPEDYAAFVSRMSVRSGRVGAGK
ncbi:MAG: 3-deoxy-manno-octulosonate cytidylyltransferase [Phycisphaerales bacterium]|nr:MAG: 3-deoxy-manno-octulosonate cytidylyltransferase [Phycisphaerales bacterium]